MQGLINSQGSWWVWNTGGTGVISDSIVGKLHHVDFKFNEVEPGVVVRNVEELASAACLYFKVGLRVGLSVIRVEMWIGFKFLRSVIFEP